MTVYTGSAFPDWQGDLISGALKFKQLRVTLRYADDLNRISPLSQLERISRIPGPPLGPS